MSAESFTPVVLMWHMHQPHYRPLNASAFRQPWSYLHAIKDYVDMAAILEQTPGARSVVNFAPVLLEQIDAYGEQIESFLAGNGEIADPLEIVVRVDDRDDLAQVHRDRLLPRDRLVAAQVGLHVSASLVV